MSESVEQRLQRVEDRFAINDLLVRYAVLLDDRRFDDVGRLFTVDGVFSSPNSRTVGRQAIVDNFAFKHAETVATWHDPHGSIARFTDDDHAVGTVIAYAELGFAEQTVATSIRYHDDYVREDGSWLFASRFVLSLFGMPMVDVVAGGLGWPERKRWPGRPVGPAELPDVDRRYDGYLGLG